MLDLNDVYYYAQVVEHRGITAAARALDVPKSSISGRILALEASLGARLIQRTSRKFVVTEIGAEFHRHALAMLVEAEAAESVVQRRTAEPSGTIRFICSVAVTQLTLAELIPKFMAAYPRVRIVQHAANRYVDPVQEGFDLCLRAHTDPLPSSSMVQRSLAQTPWYLFAGPGYLARKGTPGEPGALAEHDGIALGSTQDSYAWRLSDVRDADQVVTVPFTPSLQSDDMATLKAAACAGLGIVALPGYVGRSEVERGQLVRVLPQWIAGIATISLLMPSRRGLLPSVRAFTEFLLAHVPTAVR
ncbi:LysR family transcriptional regulator [Paraburkholderia sp. BL23I1N1]|uniref:LysR substrate-binding domain-containing protein n=1 Tax=Paraburkholderia sp. BL23I1N1 TaxID=1938802 RepID=UPI000E76F574|nr:LysR substrate-binding domain-containing protein [Paraburkholderia sp. BL23I1N1]RKE37497.1 LysR family transcriptional regulator [Paraburkholderia sp. BL23I1N1]